MNTILVPRTLHSIVRWQRCGVMIWTASAATLLSARPAMTRSGIHLQIGKKQESARPEVEEGL